MTVRLQKAQPPPSDNAIREVEEQLGLELPPSYVAALQFCNGARPEANRYHLHDSDYSIAEFLDIVHVGQVKRLQDEYNPSSRIPFAEDSFGNAFCIGTDMGEHDQIFFMDHEIPGDNAFRLIAPSFDAFFEGLQPYDPTLDESLQPEGDVWVDPDFLKSLQPKS